MKLARCYEEIVRPCWCGRCPEPMEMVSGLKKNKGAKVFALYCRHDGKWATSMTRACTSLGEAVVVWNRTHGYDAEIATP